MKDSPSDKLAVMRNPAIDGLRTLAVLAVFGVHSYPGLLPGGGEGVDVFFVISGFVITSLILADKKREQGFSFRRFYANRLRRLAPALTIVVLFVLAVSLIGIGRGFRDEWRTAPLAQFYLMDFARSFADPGHVINQLLQHTWSLAVEEQFYLLWPVILILGLARMHSANARLWLVGLACLVPLAERMLLWDGSASINRVFYGLDTRADQLLIGCFLALTVQQSHRRFDRRLGWLAWPAAGVLMVNALLVRPTHLQGTAAAAFYTVGFTIVGICAALIVYALTEPGHPLTRLLGVSYLAWPGRHLSYSFYLWHVPLLLLLNQSRISHPHGAAAFVLAWVAAFVSYRFVEQRFRRQEPEPVLVEMPQAENRMIDLTEHPVERVTDSSASR